MQVAFIIYEGKNTMEKVKEMILFALTNFWANLKTKVILKSDIVNNLTNSSTDKPLSANQGKALKENINELNENISKKQDASTAITTENIGMQSVLNANTAHSVAWDDVYSKPTTGYPPSSHHHDDRYYTESEVNNLLNGKADTAHSHAWDAITGKPGTFTPSGHNHDDRYYTESEVNNLIWNEIQVKEYSVDNLIVSTGAKTQEFSIALSGYWIVGLVQASIENASASGINSSQCSIYGYGMYSQSTAYVRFRAWSDAKVKVIIKVLYWKDPR